MSTLDIARFRDLLLDERKRVADAIAYLQEENPGSMEDEEELPSSNHPGDVATITFDREMDYTLEENSEHVLDEIDAALERIALGTYGICAGCGQSISEERLEALPYATLCIDCKRKGERA